MDTDVVEPEVVEAQAEERVVKAKDNVLFEVKICKSCRNSYLSEYAVEGIDADDGAVMCYRCWFTREGLKR